MAKKTYQTEGSKRIRRLNWENENPGEIGVLTVEFVRGGTYEYQGVSEEIYNALVASPSIGQGFETLINPSKGTILFIDKANGDPFIPGNF